MASANDIVEQLARLAKLRADGALSDEEFTAAKARIISEARQASEPQNKAVADASDIPIEAEISKLVQQDYGDGKSLGADGRNTNPIAQNPGAAWVRIALGLVVLVMALGGLGVLLGLMPGDAGKTLGNSSAGNDSEDVTSVACDLPVVVDALKFAIVCNEPNSTEPGPFCRSLGATTYRDLQKATDEQITAAAATIGLFELAANAAFNQKLKTASEEALLAMRSLFANVAAFSVATGCAARVSFDPDSYRQWLFLAVLGAALHNRQNPQTSLLIKTMMADQNQDGWPALMGFLVPAIAGACNPVIMEYSLREHSVFVQKVSCDR